MQETQAPLVGGRLLFNDGNGLYKRLRWLGPRGISAPIGLGLERIDRADLGPAGTLLAFTGVQDMENREGVARAASRNWPVYVSGIALRGRRLLLQGRFGEAPELAWAADGRTLAITVASTERAGRLLLVSRDGARTTVALRGNLGSLTWIGPARIPVVDVGARQDLSDDTILLVDVRRALAKLAR